MNKNQKKQVFYEGIKEKLDDLAEDDICFKYGRLIAIGVMDFSLDNIDKVQISQNTYTYLTNTVKNFNW